MPRHPIVCALIALGVSIAASCSTAPAQPNRYKLTTGSKVSISTTTDGRSTIVVTIPPGSPGAGEHVSTADALVEPARSAKNQLNEPGVSVVIDVDDAGHLVAIEQTQTK